MIISHEHKFIFLKTKKTAGTAIEAALSELCGPSDVITPYRRGERGRTARVGAAELPHRASAEAEAAAVAAPARAAERYYHHSVGFYEHMPRLARARLCRRGGVAALFQIRLRPQSVGPAGLMVSLQDQDRRAIRPSFEQLHGKIAAAPSSPITIYTIDGKLAVDFVGRYENLQDELAKALDLAGVGRHLEVPRTNVTPDKDQARDYRSYYSDATRERVAEWYAPEIALLHYGF